MNVFAFDVIELCVEMKDLAPDTYPWLDQSTENM